MSVSYRTQNLLAQALADPVAAAELVSADAGLPSTPTFTSVTTTSNMVCEANFSCTGDVAIGASSAVLIGGIQVVGAQQSAPANLAVTFTANAPATYASPATTLTVADGTALVAAEVFAYLDNLRGVIAKILLVLHTHGLTT